MKTPNTVFFFSIFLIITLSQFCIGQSYSAKYLISDGLPSQEIYDLHQDKNGLIWIASDRGIASFNGSVFNSYGMIDGLPSNMVFEFFEQPNGMIWCSTRENKWCFFHPDTLIFHNYKYNDLLFEFYDKLGKAEPRGLSVGKDGSIKYRLLWEPGIVNVSASGTLDFKVYDLLAMKSLMPRTIKRDKSGYPYLSFVFDENSIPPDGMGNRTRHHLFELDSSFVWTTEYAYQILDKKTLKVKKYKYLGPEGGILNVGQCEGGFWVGLAHDGVKVFDEEGRLKKHFAKDFSVTSYLKDSDGGIWLGTHGSGLLYFANSKLRVFHPSLHNEVYSLSIDGQGHLLYLTNHRNVIGLDRNLNIVSEERIDWNAKLGQYFYFDNTFHDGFPHKIEGYGFIRKYPDNRNLPPIYIFGGTLFNDKLEEFYSVSKMHHGMSDAEHFGNDFVVAQGKSIVLIDSQGNRKKKVELGALINDVDVGSDGLIYCATQWKGVFILDKNLKIVGKLNSKNGTLGDYIFEVLYENGVLWIGTEIGLCKATKLKRNQWKCENLSVEEGLPDLQVRDIEIKDGRVYLATREGVCYFEKRHWKNIVKEETRLHFKKTKLIVNGALRTHLLGLSHDENQVEIGFELITFANARKLDFRYKLLGFDDTWKITSERRVLYHSLPPGKYEFVVQSMIDGSPRGKMLHQKIEIHPPFYQRWWFHVAIWSGVVLIIWLFFKYRILNYNRGVIQEILRQISRRLRPETNQFIVRCDGMDVRIVSEEVVYVESSRNYITIYTEDTRYIVRHKISEFIGMVPDPLEYIRVKRSLIVRIDKITAKGVNTIVIRDKEFKVGKTYLENLKKIEL